MVILPAPARGRGVGGGGEPNDMNTHRTQSKRPRSATIGLALVAITGILAAYQAHAVQAGAYPPPDISNFLLVGEDDSDGDSVKETHIRHYRNVEGDRVFSMTTQGKLWAWSMESHDAASATDPERNYVIRDSDCDGTFDERYGLDEEFHVPGCLNLYRP